MTSVPFPGGMTENNDNAIPNFSKRSIKNSIELALFLNTATMYISGKKIIYITSIIILV